MKPLSPQPIDESAPPAPRPEVFRPNRWLRWSVAAAGLFWVLVFFLLVSVEEIPGRLFVAVAFFILFFGALGVFYNNMRIEVAGEGLVVRGVSGFRLVPFSEIQGIEERSVLWQTSYAVFGRQGPVFFTSFFSGHKRLKEVIEERCRDGGRRG